MAATVPVIQVGNTPATITPLPPRRQMLVENSDTTNSFTVAWNGSGGAWTLRPGTRIGIALTGGVVTVVLTPVAGTPTYQVLLQG